MMGNMRRGVEEIVNMSGVTDRALPALPELLTRGVFSSKQFNTLKYLFDCLQPTSVIHNRALTLHLQTIHFVLVFVLSYWFSPSVLLTFQELIYYSVWRYHDIYVSPPNELHPPYVNQVVGIRGSFGAVLGA